MRLVTLLAAATLTAACAKTTPAEAPAATSPAETADYLRLHPSPAELSTMTSDLDALGPLVDAYRDLVVWPPPGGDEARIALIEGVPAQIDAIEEQAAAVASAGDAQAALAARYVHVASLLYLSDAGLSVQPPEGLTEDERAIFVEILEAQVFPQFQTVQDLAQRYLAGLSDDVPDGHWGQVVDERLAAVRSASGSELPSERPAWAREP